MLTLYGLVPLKSRITTFLGNCSLKIIFDDGNFGYLGIGSIGLLKRLHVILGQQMPFPVIRIGNYCESSSSTILIGGEHLNDTPFNYSLSAFPMLRHQLKLQDEQAYVAIHPATTEIHHGVILSKDVMIMPGASIAMGSVIGAGSVVTRNTAISAFSIAVGTPAKSIKTRLTAEQIVMTNSVEWWNWDVEFFYENARLLYALEANYTWLVEHKQLTKDSSLLVVRLSGNGDDANISILGVEQNERFAAFDSLSLDFQQYFSQLTAPEDKSLTWVVNPFKLL